MDEVAVGDLRNHGGDILDLVACGEVLIVTRDGRPVAELRTLPRRPLPAATLLERWHRLPAVDAARMHADIDDVLDPSL